MIVLFRVCAAYYSTSTCSQPQSAAAHAWQSVTITLNDFYGNLALSSVNDMTISFASSGVPLPQGSYNYTISQSCTSSTATTVCPGLYYTLTFFVNQAGSVTLTVGVTNAAQGSGNIPNINSFVITAGIVGVIDVRVDMAF